MIREFRFVLVSLLVVLLTAAIAFGQETTGQLEITVKDAAGAVVPNVTVTVESEGASTGYKKVVTTDGAGFARIIQVPPGSYTVTAAPTSGFVEKKVNQIQVGLGRTTPLTLEMTTKVDASITVTGGDVNPIDVTDTKIQTTISAETAELIPKGVNFSTVLKFSPATRPESRSGQYQIDGASGSENTFIVDGIEVTDILAGTLDVNSNLPFSIVQEVQVKSSGFEAEYGGATGGVVNVVTKGGGNDFHGIFGSSFRSSKLEPIPGPGLRSNNGVPEYYPARRYQYNETNPVAFLQGPIMRDKVWFSANYSPQYFNQHRTLIYRDANRIPTGRVDTYFTRQKDEKAVGRLDAQPFSRLHLTSSVQWNPRIASGLLPSFSSELGTPPAQAGNPNLNGAAFYGQTGGRLNSIQVMGSGAYNVTNNLIITSKISHYFQNNKLSTYGFGDVTRPRIVCSSAPLSPVEFPPGFGCTRTAPNNTNGVTAFSNGLYDATFRNQFDLDATYLTSGMGRHEIKGGYQHNGIGNKVQEQTTDIITLRSGSAGLATIAAYSGRSIPSTPGAIGSGKLSIFETSGNVTSKNEALFIQDKWQPKNRLTLNLGVRIEKENVPSYAPGLPGMNFSWSSKLAPRLGAAYDLTGDGKTKVSGFYGLFYDRFKLTLPRGSFGGDVFHDFYFELFPGDTMAAINRSLIFGSGAPVPGGICPLNTPGTVYGRVRCDVDNRVSSNSGGPLTEVGGIDPHIKPFQQREITFTFERELSKNYLFRSRYTRKQVLHAIEDAGFPNSAGSEYYIIGNPGEGLYKQQADMFGTLAPKPQRQYDALEFRLDRNFANNYYFDINYTFSRLYGNYGGLASSDEEGRLDPNVERYFDQPQAGFTVAGGPDNGRLATDRPHVLKAYGAYSLNWARFGLWKSHTTDFEVFTQASSGSLITSFANVNGIEQIILTKRGDQGRTPFFTQTDLAVRHTFKFGRDGKYAIKADADIINVFNQYIVTNLGLNPDGQGGNIIANINFNPLDTSYGLITPAQITACNATPSPTQCKLITAYRTFQVSGSAQMLAVAQNPANRNPFYNVPSSYQAKRQVRYGIRFIF